MFPGTISDTDARQWTTAVLVDGVARPVASLSLSRELSSDMPAQVTAGGDLARSTGNIQWLSGQDATDAPPNPWNTFGTWLPTDGQRVQVYVSDGNTAYPRGTYLIDDATGTVGDWAASSLVDLVDRLSAQVGLPALLARMPPVDASGPWRRIGLTPRFVVDTAYRRSGFYATPAANDGTVLDVPLQGSAWPLTGTVTACERTSVTGQSPLMYENTGGFGSMGDFTATYTPSTSRTGATPVQITMVPGTSSSDLTRVRIYYGATTFALQHNGIGTAYLFSGSTNVASVACAKGETVSVLINGTTATLRTATGNTATGTVTTPSGSLTSVEVFARPGAHLAGVNVAHPAAGKEFQAMTFARTCIIEPGAMHGILAATPERRLTTASDTISEICAALLWASWIDESGVARAVASDVLRSRTPVATLTTRDHITALSWRRRYRDVRSSVQLSYQAPTVTTRTDYSVPVWESSESVSLGNGDTHEQVISASGDEYWIMPDTYLQVLGLSGEMAKLNQGVYTVAGGVVTDGTNEAWAADPANNNVTVSLTQRGNAEWVFKATAQNLTGSERVELRTLSESYIGSTGMWPMWWGKSLPIMRAKAKVEFTARARPAITAANRGPELTHDTGIWATGNTDDSEHTVVDQIGAYLAAYVTQPAPTIESLGVIYDPRLQVGDVVTIDSASFMGATLTVLITGIQESIGTEATMNLTVQVISAKKSFTTYDEFSDAWGNAADYNTLAAAWTELSTYADFNTDPKRGA